MRRGQSAVEYGLLLATIAVLVLLGGGKFGQLLRTWFETIVARVTSPS